jgi:hypothetical protein
MHEDKKAKVYFVECHIAADILDANMDLDAVIDPQNQEDYRANRALQLDSPYFKQMIEDAKKGRQFSDIVVEYNTSYKPELPLKILGGQHRTSAIQKALDVRKYHGVRVYFNLDVNKRVELYRISNTNIQVPDDLLDRLDEQSLHPPGTLREFAHEIGLLKKDADFNERKSLEASDMPTVRMLRTFVVNYYHGRNYEGKDFDLDAIVPYLCTVGGMDSEYKKIFDKQPQFKMDKELLEAGKEFAKLHKTQYDIIDKSSDARGKRTIELKL